MGHVEGEGGLEGGLERGETGEQKGRGDGGETGGGKVRAIEMELGESKLETPTLNDKVCVRSIIMSTCV